MDDEEEEYDVHSKTKKKTRNAANCENALVVGTSKR